MAAEKDTSSNYYECDRHGKMQYVCIQYMYNEYCVCVHACVHAHTLAGDPETLMDSCRVKDNCSPWPVQAFPVLISDA